LLHLSFFKFVLILTASALSVPAPRLQSLRAVAYAPWAFKPLLGLVSDLLPIAGYHKAPYMLAATLMALIALGRSLVSFSIHLSGFVLFMM
jgi:hypothetical protein